MFSSGEVSTQSSAVTRDYAVRKHATTRKTIPPIQMQSHGVLQTEKKSSVVDRATGVYPSLSKNVDACPLRSAFSGSVSPGHGLNTTEPRYGPPRRERESCKLHWKLQYSTSK